MKCFLEGFLGQKTCLCFLFASVCLSYLSKKKIGHKDKQKYLQRSSESVCEREPFLEINLKKKMEERVESTRRYLRLVEELFDILGKQNDAKMGRKS